MSWTQQWHLGVSRSAAAEAGAVATDSKQFVSDGYSTEVDMLHSQSVDWLAELQGLEVLVDYEVMLYQCIA